MKDDHLRNLVAYRLDRAGQTFHEALLMKREQHWNACINRLYYACFYAVTALLTMNGLSSSRHSGVKALFNQHFVRTGQVSREDGKIYNHLFVERQEGDYVDFVIFDKETVEPWIPQVRQFIETI